MALMFRAFDNWDTYVDLDGNPLHGCVQFNVKDGTTPAPVFDSDMVNIANPQVTDVMGRTDAQVFIDSDVVAYFYKYVGPGSWTSERDTDIDTSDESRWSLQYTVENCMVAINDEQADSAISVGTMTGLRDLDPEDVPEVDGRKFVLLLGYNEPGDKEPVYYYWDPNASGDDNGSVIKVSGVLSGRWRLVRPTEHCDSRHFGVFPQDSQYVDIDQSTQIIQLFNYCNVNRIRPFFNGSVSAPYFIYGRVSVTSPAGVDISDGTVFVDKDSGSAISGDIGIDTSFSFLNGNTSLTTKGWRASWNSAGGLGAEHCILDATTSVSTFTGCRVDVLVNTAAKTFDGCDIYSNGKLGQCTFRNCKITQQMFQSTANTPFVDDSVLVDLDDFDSVVFWMRIVEQQSIKVYDMRKRTVDSSCVCNKDGVWWLNANFSNFTYAAAATAAVFDGCIGSVVLHTGASPALSFYHCELTVSFQNGQGLPVVTIKDSNINSGTDPWLIGTLSIRDSFIQGWTISVGGNCSASGSKLACSALNVGGNANFSHCDIDTPIYQSQASVINLALQHCTLTRTYSIAGASENTTVNAVITHNYSFAEIAFAIDRTNIDPVDAHHSYRYAFNTGSFLPEVTRSKAANLTVHFIQPVGSTLRTQVDARQTGFTLMRPMNLGNDLGHTIAGIFLYNAYFDNVAFFRIGTDSFRVAVVIDKIGGASLLSGTPVAQVLEAVYVSGYTFGLRTKLVGEWQPDPSTHNYSMAQFPSFYQAIALTGLPKTSGSSTPASYTQTVELHYENMDARD